MKYPAHLPVLLALSAVLFLVNLGVTDLWAPDEARFAEVAREMVRSGDWLAPHVNGEPYTEKPPLYFWAEALFSLPVGDVTAWPARLPSALAGMATALLTFLLARRLHGPRVAFWAALVLMTGYRFWWQSRVGQLDMLLTAFLAGALYCFHAWHTDRRPAALAGFYLCIAAGALTKGPPAAVFPLLMVATFYWGRKAERRGLRLGWGLAGAALLTALWLVPARLSIAPEMHAEASTSIAANLYRQTVGRFFLGVAHANPPWFYLESLPGDLLPWSLFLPWTVWWTWKRRREGEAMRLLLSWTLPALVFFSLCLGKRAIYLLPLYPAFAILLARSVLDLLDAARSRGRRTVAGLWGGVLLAGSAVPLVLGGPDLAAAPGPALYALSAGAFSFGLWGRLLAWRTDGRKVAVHLASSTALLMVLATFAVLPALDARKSPRPLCEPLRHLAREDEAYNLYSLGFSREEYVYYADHFHDRVLCEMLDIEGMAELSPLEQGRRQLAMQRAIQKAVKTVPVERLVAVSDAEIAALRAAIEERLRPPEGEADYLAQYETAVTTELDRLLDQAEAPEPAYVLVQGEDWRWVLAFRPDARRLRVVGDDTVGSRHLLLLANGLGDALLQEHRARCGVL